MTPKRKGAVVKTVKEITIGAALTVALLNGGMMLQSCSSSSDDNDQQETPYKGRPVKTYITELKPGEFKITDEVAVNSDAEAGAIVRYYDGRRDTLTVNEAKNLVKTDSTTREYYSNPNHYHSHHHHSSSLSNALLWGGMGYMLGRNNNSQFYNEGRERGYSSGAYANSAVYQRSAGIHESYHSHRKSVAARPSRSRSGFFSRSGRSFGG
ncbi:hypothetical protein [Runella sp.]|uniref:hypothetical protein n=1 Tax=Runella sp. TaxID=1960881 RepID=UPI003D11B47D